MDRRLGVVGAAAVAVAIAVGVLVGRPPVPSGVPSRALVTMTTQSAALTVHVSGSVVRPGLVTVGEGARAADAIAAAGGATPEADLGALNLAEPVFDGTRLHVPKLGQTEVVPATGTEADGLISINRATATELQDLPGVGPVLAQRIIDHRDDIGGFSAVEDLLDVPGIGERILAGMRDLIVVP